MSLSNDTGATATTIELVKTQDFESWCAELTPSVLQWVSALQFEAKSGQHAWLPDASGEPAKVVVGWDGSDNLATLGGLPYQLAEGTYALSSEVSQLQLLGWGLGAYRFTRYKAAKREPATLLIPDEHDSDSLLNAVAAITLVRDLINIPAGDLVPSALADEASQVADANQAECLITVGDDLLSAGFGAIHAVGRAADDAPRLIDITWGDPGLPVVALIGKGVCFDSGGLDLKPASAMRSMKKDMGGAAHVLGLAQLIMSANLPVRLRVLISAVENAISGNAFRPGDVLQTYAGITVEVDNTDAEGRLVMCDALALAAETKPDLIIDFSTLTGSARSAVGPEIAAMFCNSDDVADGLHAAGVSQDDPVWRLPLHQGYGHMLDSGIADTVNSASSPYAGAITAALFLEKFVANVPWAHFDVMAYNTRNRPGHPEGGEALGVRASFEFLKQKYGG